jgi:hypothetical protein
LGTNNKQGIKMKAIVKYTTGSLVLIEFLETQHKLYWKYDDRADLHLVKQYSKEEFYEFAKKEWGWVSVEEVKQ